MFLAIYKHLFKGIDLSIIQILCQIEINHNLRYYLKLSFTDVVKVDFKSSIFGLWSTANLGVLSKNGWMCLTEPAVILGTRQAL